MVWVIGFPAAAADDGYFVPGMDEARHQVRSNMSCSTDDNDAHN
jgi:hypothetical protein